MNPLHQKIAEEFIDRLLAQQPDAVVLAKYESQLDYETLRPEDKPARVEDHAAMIDHVAARVAMTCPWVMVSTPVINAEEYLRWLAANELKNTAENRAAFVSAPPLK